MHKAASLILGTQGTGDYMGLYCLKWLCMHFYEVHRFESLRVRALEVVSMCLKQIVYTMLCVYVVSLISVVSILIRIVCLLAMGCSSHNHCNKI